MGGSARSVFTDLRPDKFGGIEFRGTGGKLIDMQPRMAHQKFLHRAAPMDGMLIPQQHKRTREAMQQRREKADDVRPAEGVPERVQTQLDLAFPGRHAHGTK